MLPLGKPINQHKDASLRVDWNNFIFFSSEAYSYVLHTTPNSKMKASRYLEVNPWKCGREARLMFFILASPLVSLVGKTSLSLFLPIVSVGEVGSSSSPICSSKISSFSSRGSYNSFVAREESSQPLMSPKNG